MFTSETPTCTGRTLDLPRKDRDIRYLRPLGNSDIAELKHFCYQFPVRPQPPEQRGARERPVVSSALNSHINVAAKADASPGLEAAA